MSNIKLKGLVIVHGEQGAGKTLFLVKTAFEERDRFDKIYSNFHLVGIDYEKFDIVELLLNKKEIKNSIVLIDEGHQFFNARRHMSAFNVLCDYFFDQTRKRNNLVLVTTIPHKLDISLREYASFFHVFPEPLLKQKNKLIPIEPSIAFAYDLDVRYFRVKIYNQTGERLIASYVYDASKYFDKYDTDEIIMVDWARLSAYARKKSRGDKK